MYQRSQHTPYLTLTLDFSGTMKGNYNFRSIVNITRNWNTSRRGVQALTQHVDQYQVEYSTDLWILTKEFFTCESTSQIIFFFTIFLLVLEKKAFFLTSPFFEFTSMGCSIPFRVFITQGFVDPKARHGL